MATCNFCLSFSFQNLKEEKLRMICTLSDRETLISVLLRMTVNCNLLNMQIHCRKSTHMLPSLLIVYYLTEVKEAEKPLQLQPQHSQNHDSGVVMTSK